jgi:hypothetical protein
VRDPNQYDEKGRPRIEHWLGIAKRTAQAAGVDLDLEQAWAFRRALFDARAEGYRDGLRDAPFMPAADDRAQENARALADVRTLDEWAAVSVPRKNWTMADDYGSPACLVPGTTRWFYGATPGEARAHAAAWVREQQGALR